MLVDDSLLERNDGVVSNGNVLRTYLGAALRNVAVPDAVALFQLVCSVENVERVHLELRRVDQQSRPHELLVKVVVPENVTDVLAEKALDALAKFLNAVGV